MIVGPQPYIAFYFLLRQIDSRFVEFILFEDGQCYCALEQRGESVDQIERVVYCILNIIADKTLSRYFWKASIAVLCIEIKDDSLLLWFLEGDSLETEGGVVRIERLYELCTIGDLRRC